MKEFDFLRRRLADFQKETVEVIQHLVMKLPVENLEPPTERRVKTDPEP